MRNLFLVLSCLSVLAFAPLESNAAAKKVKAKPVELSEIRSWQSFGSRWVMGLGQNKEPLAIYDLSYPDWKSRLGLGCLDHTCANYDTLIEILTAGGKEALLSPAEQQDFETALKTLTDLKLHTDPVALANAGSVLPPKWWKEVPWKNQLMAQSETAPAKFLLSDLNIDAVVDNPQHFRAQLDQVSEKFLEQVEFVKTSTGGYQFYWLTEPDENGFYQVDLNDAPKEKLSFKPKKMVDLRCTKCEMKISLIKQGVQEALGNLIGLIPNPVVAGLIGVSINEFMHFKNELKRLHQEMILEMVQAAEENQDKYSPLAGSNPLVLQKSVENLLYSQTSLFTGIKWAFTKPDKEWEKAKKKANEQIGRSLSYIQKKAQQMTSLNHRFAIGADSQKSRFLYSLAAPRFGKLLSPLASVDYQNPMKNISVRMSVESSRVLVQFLKYSIPIPGVGGIVGKIFDLTVDAPMHASQYWEARLAAHLLARQEMGEKWELELDRIHSQEINPLSLDRERTERLVLERKRELGVLDYDEVD